LLFTVFNSEHVSVHKAFETAAISGWVHAGLILILAFFLVLDFDDHSDSLSKSEFRQAVYDANMEGNAALPCVFIFSTIFFRASHGQRLCFWPFAANTTSWNAPIGHSVPIAIRIDRGQSLALKWFVKYFNVVYGHKHHFILPKIRKDAMEV
jgi:hypothetical protein